MNKLLKSVALATLLAGSATMLVPPAAHAYVVYPGGPGYIHHGWRDGNGWHRGYGWRAGWRDGYGWHRAGYYGYGHYPVGYRWHYAHRGPVWYAR